MAASIVGMILMILSQVVAWPLVLKPRTLQGLCSIVWKIALFFCGWALVNRFMRGDEGELGHFSFGLLVIATLWQKRYFAAVADVVVLLNYGLAATFCIKYNPKDLAELITDDDSTRGIVWAYIFKTYVLSSIALWCTVLYRLIKLPADYTPVASTPEAEPAKSGGDIV